MREIKFRGKRLDNGEWVYGDLIHSGTDTIAILEPEAPCLGIVTDVVPESVGQFTGLHDKNGKEIYEGDIVRVGILSPNYIGSHPEPYYVDTVCIYKEGALFVTKVVVGCAFISTMASIKLKSSFNIMNVIH